MTDPTPEKQKQLAVKIASHATTDEKQALRLWIEKLLELRGSNLSAVEKAKKALHITSSSRVVLPSVKLLARETKRHAWDDRGLKGRLGLGGAAVGIALFGGQAAGVAALGTAIGVPLWVIFGAGASFVGVLYEEITGHKPPAKTSYEVIDAERQDDSK